MECLALRGECPAAAKAAKAAKCGNVLAGELTVNTCSPTCTKLIDAVEAACPGTDAPATTDKSTACVAERAHVRHYGWKCEEFCRRHNAPCCRPVFTMRSVVQRDL